MSGYVGCACDATELGHLRAPCHIRTFPMVRQDEPHGVIDLKDCLTVKSADEKTGKPHSFEVATPEQVYFMFADSEAQKVTSGAGLQRASHAFSPTGNSRPSAAPGRVDRRHRQGDRALLALLHAPGRRGRR